MPTVWSAIPTVLLLRYAMRSLRPFGLNAGRIVCGAGSDELLNLLASAYLGPGDEAIYTEHGFLVYRIAILANGATPVVAPERDFTTDVDAILDRVTEKTKVVFLANPNNPTGSYIPFQDVRRLRDGLPSHVLLVLDAAYAEYVERNDYEAGIELVATTENTVMTRTFSQKFMDSPHCGWGGCMVLRTSWTRSTEFVGLLMCRRLPLPPVRPQFATMHTLPELSPTTTRAFRWFQKNCGA